MWFYSTPIINWIFASIKFFSFLSVFLSFVVSSVLKIESSVIDNSINRFHWIEKRKKKISFIHLNTYWGQHWQLTLTSLLVEWLLIVTKHHLQIAIHNDNKRWATDSKAGKINGNVANTEQICVKDNPMRVMNSFCVVTLLCQFSIVSYNWGVCVCVFHS